MSRFAGILIGLIVALPLTAIAAGGPDIVAGLVALKVSRNAAGVEAFAAATHTNPGETLEYRATYKNVSRNSARGVVATLPIPSNGIELSSIDAKLPPTSASLDGVQYAAYPLVRTVKRSDGSSETVRVPLAEYRSLRWTLGDMAAGTERTVTARMQIVHLASSTATVAVMR